MHYKIRCLCFIHSQLLISWKKRKEKVQINIQMWHPKTKGPSSVGTKSCRILGFLTLPSEYVLTCGPKDYKPPTPQKNVCIYSVGVCIEGQFALTGSLSSLINLTRRKKEWKKVRRCRSKSHWHTPSRRDFTALSQVSAVNINFCNHVVKLNSAA